MTARGRGNPRPYERWRDRSASRSLPNRLSRARQAEARPLLRHRGDDLVGHADLGAPVALGLGRPFVGGVEADLRAEAGLWGGEIEIVDRRVLDQRDVARR